MKYRADIDGLRGISILAVVLYHAFPDIFFNGYLGVDIFFVISGFLITLLILNDLETNRFSLLNFYIRRIKRILPTALIVILFTTLVGVVTLHADELENLNKYIKSASLFYTNFQLAADAGYFDLDIKYKPLMHYWSLAVEEQFYLIWPIFISGLYCMRLGRPLKIKVALTLCVSIFLYSIYLFSNFENQQQVYLSFEARIWQLMLGGFAAVFSLSMSSKINKKVKSAGSLLGVVFLTSSLMQNQFAAATLACAGAALIILGGEDTFVNRFLSHRILVVTGLLSYSLYLWHWPVLSFLRIYSPSIGTLSTLIAVAAATLLSCVTYSFIEKPLRQQNWYFSNPDEKFKNTFSVLLKPALVFLMSFVLFFMAFLLRPLFSQTHSKLTQGQKLNPDLLLNRCYIENNENSDQLAFCNIGVSAESRKKGLIVGDSHANALFPGLIREISSVQWHLVAHHSCDAFFINRNEKALLPCQMKIYQALQKARQENFDHIIFVTASRVFNNLPFSKGPLETDFLSDFIQQSAQAATQIILLKPVPEINDNVNRCTNRRIEIIQKFIEKNIQCEMPIEIWREKSLKQSILIDQLKTKHPEITIYNQADSICLNSLCQVQSEKTINYIDRDHLSMAGSQMVAQNILKILALQ